MKKWFLFYLLLFSTTLVFSQEERKLLKGYIHFDDYPLKDVHILNKTSEIGTITNDAGIFKILAKKNDTLSISHLNFITKEIIVSEEIINNGIALHLEDKTYVLEEVTVGKHKSIFHIDKDIMPHNAPTVNAKTLKLPYANSKPKKDERVIKIRSGFAISLPNLINSLNGNNRRARKANELYKQDKNLQKIRKHFTDDFFVTDLKVKKKYINQFLNYCVSKNIIQLYKKDNQLKLIKVLLKESKTFPHQIEDENTFFTKK